MPLPALLALILAAALPEPAAVELITVGPGATYWERFGHNAILVRPADGGPAISYNYGIFDFTQQNFLLNFIRGRMSYRLAAFDAEADLADYAAAGRTVVSQRLNLSAPQARRLFEFLEWNRRPANAGYRYDYFLANCSTKVRDALDLALDGALSTEVSGEPTAHTFRDFTNRYAAPVKWMYLGTQLGLGRPTDRPISRWETFFIPDELRRGLEQVVIEGRPLVADTRVLNASTAYPVPAAAPRWTLRFLLAGLAVAVLIGLSGRRPGAQRALVTSWWIACGLIGLGMLGIWGLTEHTAAYRNENLLIFSPLALLPGLAWIGQPPGARAAAILLALVLIPPAAALALDPTGWLIQYNREWEAFALPIHLVAALACYRMSRTSPVIPP